MRPTPLLAIGSLYLAAAGCTARAEKPGLNNAITDVPGITIGHYTAADTDATLVLAVSPAKKLSTISNLNSAS